MNIRRFNLTDDGRVYMVSYICDKSPEMPHMDKRPAVVVCPGGGYMMTSDREAEVIAVAFLAQGFNAFVVRYSVGEYAAYPNSLVDLSRAMKLIRENAEEFCIFTDKIAVCGFSAGGHLVASLGTLWNDSEVREISGCLNEENKPNALILCYPVITATKFLHEGSINVLMQNITDPDERKRYIDKLSCEKNVGGHTPPAFIVHTYADNDVAVENSLLFANSLAENDIPFELHIYQDGPHGIALGNHITYAGSLYYDDNFAAWINLSCKWLLKLFGDNTPEPMRPIAPYENRAKGF